MSNDNPYPIPDLGEVELVEVLRAVADPVRLQIVRVLADGHAHPKSQPEWGLDLQKSTLSHHFRILRESGLTETLVDGRTHEIRLRRSELDARFPGLIESLLTS